MYKPVKENDIVAIRFSDIAEPILYFNCNTSNSDTAAREVAQKVNFGDMDTSNIIVTKEVRWVFWGDSHPQRYGRICLNMAAAS